LLPHGPACSPDVVLLDLGLPDLDGHETCRRIRQLSWGARARIIALTGRSLESEYVKAEQAGFDSYVLKPIGKATLVELLTGPPKSTWAERPEWLDKG
jgi:DNA-binding response OmpR family regulator